MILLDTHIWRWWVADDARLSVRSRRVIEEWQAEGLGVSIISCWEIAKKVEIGKLTLDRPVGEWLTTALGEPGIALLPLTVPIALASTQLPQPVHRDPADQILVATSRVLSLPLLTDDEKLLAYPHVTLALMNDES